MIITASTIYITYNNIVYKGPRLLYSISYNHSDANLLQFNLHSGTERFFNGYREENSESFTLDTVDVHIHVSFKPWIPWQ